MKTVGLFKDLHWPVASQTMMDSVQKPFRNQRYSISGYWTGTELLGEVFSDQFARFNGSRHCVCTSNGTSALTIALEALGVGYRDEVIVPALTWHAPATAVLNINAFPVLVDVEESTYCMDPERVRAAITPLTKAIIVVHLYGNMAAMDEIMSIAREYGVSVIEDCAQVHGTIYDGKRAGTFGDIGMFSFHQGKLMSSGEGGAAITDSTALYGLLQQLRADSRSKVASCDGIPHGGRDLENTGAIQGNNHAMSEFQAALLLDQLAGFDEMAAKKMAAANYLDSALSTLSGVRIMGRSAKVSLQTFYGYVFKVDARDPDTGSAGLCREIIRRLGLGEFFVHPAYQAVHRQEVFCPWTKKRFIPEFSKTKEYWRGLSFPAAESARDGAVVLHHSILLQPRENLDALVECIGDIRSAS